jgi:UDP-glucose 4-epimerase
MRILITGGWGFVGGRLGQYLQLGNHKVVLASRVLHNTPEWLPGAKTVCIDWHSTASMEQACEGIDVIVHAAGMNAQDCNADPIAALSVNGLATEQLINAAISRSVKRFIYLSTAHVYANPLVGDISDSTIPRNPHPYATSHLAGERALLNAQHNGDIEGVVLRLSNAFGSPTHKEVNCWMLLVNDLCKQAVQTNRMEVNSSGLQYRDFISMTEVCKGISYIIENNSITGCFNLCSEYSITILAMGELIKKRCNIVLNTHPTISSLPVQPGEKHEILNCTMAGLKKAGLCISRDITPEIDMLLLSCKKWFCN